MSSGRRFSYTPTMSPRREQTTPKKKSSNILTELVESDKMLFGIIGAGIVVAIILDAIVHMKQPQFANTAGLDRLQINGRIYVPLP